MVEKPIQAAGVSPSPTAGPQGSVIGLLCVLWIATGANFIGFKVAVAEIAPFTLTAIRLAAAAIILLPIVLHMSRGGLRLGRQELAAIFVTACLFLVVGQGLTVVGIQGMPSGYAALLTATVPLFTVLIEWVWRDHVPGRRVFAGLGIGIAGLTFVVAPSLAGGVSAGAVLVVLLGAFGWAVGTVWAQTLAMPPNALATTFGQMVVAALVLGVLAWLTEPAFAPFAVSLGVWAAVLWVVIVGSVIGYGLFVYVRPKVSSVLANSLFYVAPIVTLLLGAAMLDEPLGWREVIGAALTISGVLLILRDRSSGRDELPFAKKESR